jgi:hypothetical protein
MDRYLSIGDHGLTGDLQAGALVTTDGGGGLGLLPAVRRAGRLCLPGQAGSVVPCRRRSEAGPLRSSVWCQVFRLQRWWPSAYTERNL